MSDIVLIPVHLDFQARADGPNETATGTITFIPNRRQIEDDHIVVPDGFVVRYLNTPQDITLAQLPDGMAWKALEIINGMKVERLIIPDPDVPNYSELPDVDEDDLDPIAPPTAAWVSALGGESEARAGADLVLSDRIDAKANQADLVSEAALRAAGEAATATALLVKLDAAALDGNVAALVPVEATAAGLALAVPRRDSLSLERVERQTRQLLDSYNRRTIARNADATTFTELWADHAAWTGTATVSGGKMFGASTGINHAISVPVGGRRIFRAALNLPASSTKYSYFGISADAAGAAPTAANALVLGISSGALAIIAGANITGTVSNGVTGTKGAGVYIFTCCIDEISVSFSVQAQTNPGTNIASFSVLRSQIPGGTVNNIELSTNSVDVTQSWGPLQDITDLCPPVPANRTPGGVSLWGATNPILINRKDSGHQTATITGTPTGGTFTLTYVGQTTTPLAYNATGPQVKAALEALTTVGAGNCQVNKAGAVYAIRLKGALGLVAMTVTPSLTGGSSPTVAIAQAAVRQLAQIPGDYDPRVPIPGVLHLHWSVTGTAVTPYSDARMTTTTNNVVVGGYAFLSSDNGPATTAGGTQDSFGNQYGIDDYASLIDWFRSHFNTGPLFLHGGSQGAIFIENILASRLANAIGNIAAVMSISPARDLNVSVLLAGFTSLFLDAYGAADTTDFRTKVVGYNPIALTAAQVRGIPHRDYVSAGDTTADPAAHTTPFKAKLDGWVPDDAVFTDPGSTHLATALFTQSAADIVAYFNTYR